MHNSTNKIVIQTEKYISLKFVITQNCKRCNSSDLNIYKYIYKVYRKGLFICVNDIHSTPYKTFEKWNETTIIN